ncbi:unnamed protein product [Rotaria sp. Silwood1]|nr:unnamed protein product [Rotaria sp. Silwood1]CAF0991058.1 unnamed protein product [Rotaria sp. Silwood1]CAF1000000.1 unnamed protein product [Rotaria sp. Silwood1]CAF3396148.1 unnamed protein product [Rotaria sp. Silwood1]CAF3422180.1 unnamed protein product [Rotaria sp. Silwood1]
MQSTLFIIFLLIGISHGVFGPISQIVNNVGDTFQSTANQIGQTIENSWNNITRHIENAISQLVNTANGIEVTADFLWEQVFNPAFDMMIQGGQLVLNNQLNTVGYRVEHPTTISKNLLTEKYSQLIARLKSNVHHLYEFLFLMQREALMALEKGEYNFEEKIRAFYDKMDAIPKQINQWAIETKHELEMHANTIQGDWLHILSQYNQNIDVSVKALVTIFQQLIETLMKTYLKVVLNVVPNAVNTIENLKRQGLLSFFPLLN